jgi:hypothetical protein
MLHAAEQCTHGFILTPQHTGGIPKVVVVPCKDVPDCPAFDAPEFRADDLRLIMAMCVTANPWFPDRDMYQPWDGVYRRAKSQLANRHPDA